MPVFQAALFLPEKIHLCLCFLTLCMLNPDKGGDIFPTLPEINDMPLIIRIQEGRHNIALTTTVNSFS